MGVVHDAKCVRGEIICIVLNLGQLTKKEPAIKSEVMMWSVVAVLVRLPLTTVPRGRGDAVLLLINHKMLFLCTDTNLAGNNMNTESRFQIQFANKKIN